MRGDWYMVVPPVFQTGKRSSILPPRSIGEFMINAVKLICQKISCFFFGHDPQPFGKGQVVTCALCGKRQYGGDKLF